MHHIEEKSAKLLGAMLQISQNSPLRIMMISRSRPSVYDRRDVHIRDLVSELPLKGLSIAEMKDWMRELEVSEDLEVIFQKTGGHEERGLFSHETSEIHAYVKHFQNEHIRFT